MVTANELRRRLNPQKPLKDILVEAKAKGGGGSQSLNADFPKPAPKKPGTEQMLKGTAKKEEIIREQAQIKRTAGRPEALELAAARAEASGLGAPQLVAGNIISPETEAEALFLREQQEEKFKEETGAGETLEELEAGIVDEPSLAPEGVIDTATGLLATPGTVQQVALGNFMTGILEKITGNTYGRTSVEEALEKNPIMSRVLGGSLAVAEGALLAIGGAAALTTVLASSLATKAAALVSGKIAATGATLAGLAATGFGVAEVIDIKGSEIDTLKQQIAGYSEISSELRADVEAGMDAGVAVKKIGDMVKSVQEAESRIKQLGSNNIKFRTSKEYLDVQVEALDTRTSLYSALGEIVTLAASGEVGLSPEQLMARNMRYSQ